MPPKRKASKRSRRSITTNESDDSYTSETGSTHRGGAPQPKHSKSSNHSSKGTTESDSDGAPGNETHPAQGNSMESEVLKEDLDKYCKMCDDGGNLIECDGCRFSYCYDEVPSLPDDSEDAPTPQACISVPKGYVLDPFTLFYCPNCISEHPELPLDYHINRGFCTTQRRAVNFQVIILLSYLPELESRAKRIYDSIRSLLGAFEIVANAFYLPLPETLHKSNKSWILQLEYPYHLVFLFVTETNPGGGWWVGERAQTDEAQWLSGLVTLYTDIAEKAVTARIFGLCCGLNLPEEQTIPTILRSLSNSHWDSIMLPTASSLLPEELATIFPELFGQIYYNGIAVKTAVLRVWATSQRARVHTDILLIHDLRGQPVVKKYRYGSLSSRPYGIDLPAAWIFCLCARDGDVPKWIRKVEKNMWLHNEFLIRYRTSCNHAHLDLAIFTGTASIRESAGVQVIVEDFDPQMRMFPLDSLDSIAMKPFLGTKSSRGAEHTSAWTPYGKQLEAAGQPS